MDCAGRILAGRCLRDGPDARWLSVVGRGIRTVSLRRRSLYPLATACGQQLPDKPYSLLVTRDGTLWIGTFAGLVSWNGDKLTQYPEVGELFVTSLLEDREGTVWAGTMTPPGNSGGRLCAIRSGRAECYGQDGAFGIFVWSLGEDSSGALWAGAESGVWRWKPGPPSYMRRRECGWVT
jgi:ligand-binding sensor domain-containing protein